MGLARSYELCVEFVLESLPEAGEDYEGSEMEVFATMKIYEYDLVWLR
jgi:hypothetical protein